MAPLAQGPPKNSVVAQPASTDSNTHPGNKHKKNKAPPSTHATAVASTAASAAISLSVDQVLSLQQAFATISSTFAALLPATAASTTGSAPCTTAAPAVAVAPHSPVHPQPPQQELPTGKKNKKKDPNAPHRAPSGYHLFLADKSREIKLENAELEQKDIMSQCGKAWRALSDDERKAYEWNQLALPGQQEYATKKAEYKAAIPPASSVVAETSEGAGSPSTRKKRAKRDPSLPKLPLNAYALFARDRHPVVKGAHPEFKSTDVMREIGGEWKALAGAPKAIYERQARELKTDYVAQLAAIKALPAVNEESMEENDDGLADREDNESDNHEDDGNDIALPPPTKPKKIVHNSPEKLEKPNVAKPANPMPENTPVSKQNRALPISTSSSKKTPVVVAEKTPVLKQPSTDKEKEKTKKRKSNGVTDVVAESPVVVSSAKKTKTVVVTQIIKKKKETKTDGSTGAK
ncbi:hypothetical protein HDU82_005101 [Entophlyctis luteolus]|nr:hypothetical protein HDU82_005101 [Entophlyctis luteolus]